jgi:hypothetical protein
MKRTRGPPEKYEPDSFFAEEDDGDDEDKRNAERVRKFEETAAMRNRRLVQAQRDIDQTTFVRIDGRPISLFNHGLFHTGAALRAVLPTIGRGVSVRPSTLGPFAGRGLFADRDFAVGEIISYYDGQVIRYRDMNDVPKRWRSHMRAVYPHKYGIVGNYLFYNNAIYGRGAAAFANTLEVGDDRHHFNASALFPIDTKANLTFGNPFDRVVVTKATTRIRAGQEIFLPYGPAYVIVIGKDEDSEDGDDEEKKLDIVTPTDFDPVEEVKQPEQKKRRVEPERLSMLPAHGGGDDLHCYQCGETATCHLAQRLFCSHACLFNYSLDERNGFPPHEVVIALTNTRDD